MHTHILKESILRVKFILNKLNIINLYFIGERHKTNNLMANNVSKM